MSRFLVIPEESVDDMIKKLKEEEEKALKKSDLHRVQWCLSRIDLLEDIKKKSEIKEL